MFGLSLLKLLLTHPLEFRTLLQFYIYHERKRDITSANEFATSGYNRESMRKCWHFLDMTSRSFASVIKELDGDLARAICLFYLVLRGLDTIEDDMTIPDPQKQKLLRSFHEHTVTPGWNFDGSGPNEEDRQLLVEYDNVVEEVNLLSPEYRAVVLDICQKMETGMADFAHSAATADTETPWAVETIDEYDLYCHYVAGLVGEGLSGIWAASGKEDPKIASKLRLSNSMGLFLQKTNITRDFREDFDDTRYFWPKEIWGAHGLQSIHEMTDRDPIHAKKALWALNAMVLDALRHATDCLDYLRLLSNQTVFCFCAIPQTMAIATLALCYNNPAVLERNVKIRKAEAAKLIMQSTNPRDTAYIFLGYARQIHAKALPSDPNFLKVSVACGKIEQWCELHYPSCINISDKQAFINPQDARSSLIKSQLYADKRETTHTSNSSSSLPTDVILYVLGALTIVGISFMGGVWLLLRFFD